VLRDVLTWQHIITIALPQGETKNWPENILNEDVILVISVGVNGIEKWKDKYTG